MPARAPVPLLNISNPLAQTDAPGRRFALFELGFRPFYLMASAFAVTAIFVWLRLLNAVPWAGQFEPLAWHTHEMLFGFALAVITGFTLTAGRVWTGLETLRRGPLALLAAHWLLARVLMFTGPAWAAALADIAFPLVVAAVMARVLLKSGDRHNLFVCAFFALMALADAAFFLEQSGMAGFERGKPATAALYLIVMLVILIGGRVIPSFTANATGARVSRSTFVEACSIGLALAAFSSALAGLPAWCTAPLASGACAAHLVRQAGWAPLSTFRTPLLWILHVSYAWIAGGLALLALESAGYIWGSFSVHALGAGAMGGMIVAMITRTALGHTGRALRAGKWEVTAFVLVHAGAICRVLAALPSRLDLAYITLLDLSAVLWSAAFLIYFVVYLPRLVLSRTDGKPA